MPLLAAVDNCFVGERLDIQLLLHREDERPGEPLALLEYAHHRWSAEVRFANAVVLLVGCDEFSKDGPKVQ